MMTLPAQDPSRSSYYISDQFYRELIANFTDWQHDDRAVADPAEQSESRDPYAAAPRWSAAYGPRFRGDDGGLN
jgi:hypothetical protein